MVYFSFKARNIRRKHSYQIFYLCISYRLKCNWYLRKYLIAP